MTEPTVVDLILDAIPAALSRETEVVQAQDGIRVLLPVPDAFGDFIRLGVVPRGEADGRVIVTDMGHTCSDVAAMTGRLKANTERRQLFAMAAHNHGVQMRDGCLEVECAEDAVGDALLAVMGAVKQAHQLVHYGRGAIGRMFREEVGVWFRANSIDVLAECVVSGRSPVAHTIDFVVEGAVPTYIETISNESKMRGALLAFYDLAGTHEFRSVALIDDEDDSYTNRTFQQLAYLVPYVYTWSQREQLLELLAA